MRQAVKTVRRKHGTTIYLIGCVVAAAFMYLTRPDPDSFFEMQRMRVVGLENVHIDPSRGPHCILSGDIRLARPGERLYVLPEITAKRKFFASYRTHIRNLRFGQNVYDDDWSKEFLYGAGPGYCWGHPLDWWTGRAQPQLAPGTYVLGTSYLVRENQETSRFLEISEFLSEPFDVVPWPDPARGGD